jgi:hypothetical protein
VGANGLCIFAQETVTANTADNARLFASQAAQFGGKLYGDNDTDEEENPGIHQDLKKLMQ